MFRYYLHKLFILALSLGISVCMVVFSFSVLSIGLFHGEAFVESALNGNSEEIISTVNTELEKTAKSLSIPKEMLTTAITQENANVITKEVAHNFVYGYSTSFANSTDLYSAIVHSISEYANENKVKMTDIETSRIASVAVDAVNEAIGSSDTSNVRIFRFVRSKRMMVVLTASVLLAIAAVFLLDLLNRGVHRKFNYIGLGISTAGAILISGTVTAFVKGFVKGFRFCVIDAYNNSIIFCYSMLLNILFVLGVAFFVVGFIMLYKNYVYYKRKKEFRKARLLKREETLSDYMDNYYEKNTITHMPGDEYEKDVKKIDFDE